MHRNIVVLLTEQSIYKEWLDIGSAMVDPDTVLNVYTAHNRICSVKYYPKHSIKDLISEFIQSIFIVGYVNHIVPISVAGQGKVVK